MLRAHCGNFAGLKGAISAQGETMKQYKGITIERAGMNSSGIRWTASTGSGLILKADTLAGIKQLINAHTRA